MSVAEHLRDLVPFLDETVHWPHATFRMQAFCSDRPVPAALFGSSRAVVFRGDDVLVLQNVDGAHLLPGGRRERDESPEETVRREVLEETGWSLARLVMFAVVHLHFDGPPAAEHVGPHPDLLWPIYRGEALDYTEQARTNDGYELSSAFLPVSEALTMSWGPLDDALLRLAIDVGHSGGADRGSPD